MQQYYDYSDCDLRETDFTGQPLTFAKFIRCKAAGAIFNECDLRYADFTWADLRGAYFVDADLREADFHGANLAHATLTRCKWRSTELDMAPSAIDAILTDNCVVTIEDEQRELEHYRLEHRPVLRPIILERAAPSKEQVPYTERRTSLQRAGKAITSIVKRVFSTEWA
jgi:hypothetical protein